jgi:hypothetical protein
VGGVKVASGSRRNHGTAIPFKLRWVLVDAQAEDDWNDLGLEEQQRVNAVVKTGEGVKYSYVGTEDRLEALGVCDNTVFHLRGIDSNPGLRRAARVEEVAAAVAEAESAAASSSGFRRTSRNGEGIARDGDRRHSSAAQSVWYVATLVGVSKQRTL